MSFSLPIGLRDFFNFKDLRMYSGSDRGVLGEGQMILFDGYYASLLVGVLHTGIGKSESLETEAFISGYPIDYKASREFIAALIVEAELRRVATKEYKQNDFEHAISKLLQVDAPTGLSSEGLELSNLYAAGGFAFLADKLRPKPSNAVNFFLRFNDLCVQEGILDEQS